MNETVHIANVANFIRIFKKIRNLKLYDPLAAKLKIDSLEELKEELKQTVKEVSKAEKLVKTSQEKRNFLYYETYTRAQFVSIYISQIAKNEDHLRELKSILQKITGQNPSEIKPSEVIRYKDLPKKSKSVISSKLFDTRKKLFYQMIILLAKTPEYIPTEKSIQLKPLNNLKKLIQIHNRNFLKREEVLEKSKQYRDLLLYHENIGATVLAKRIKQYVYQVYKPASKEYKRVKSIPFQKVDGINRQLL